MPPGSMAATTRSDHCVLLMALDARSEPSTEAAQAALRVHGSVAGLAASATGGRSALVAYGNAIDDWTEAIDAYRQARLAATVSKTVSDLGPVVGWAQLGAYQALSLVPPQALGGTDADRRLDGLLSKPELLLTLESYLDLAGDAKRTSEQLNLHRASLYYRLHRIEEILGVDLKRGEDRLTMHVALKTLRLRGLLP
jgi:sugar diacid utilization regulator